jgi:hypothetical protein
LGGERVGELLQSFRLGALQEGVLALSEGDALLAHAKRQPIVLIEADSGGERKVGTHANEHGPPVLVVEIEIVLIYPALLKFQVRAVVLLSSNGDQDAGGFASLQNDSHMIGFGLLQVRQHEIVAPLLLRRLDDGCTPVFRTILQPMVELVGDLGEGLTGYSSSVAIGVEESEYPFGLLEGLNQSVQ